MAGRYERVRSNASFPGHDITANRRQQVNAHDDEEPDTPVAPQQMQPIPNSPPPSFHSRASSLERRSRVDPTLEDAFDGDESDDEPDDRQRLVRTNTSPATSVAPGTPIEGAASTQARTTRNGYEPVAQPSSTHTPLRVFGGGTQADGVFSNMSARPDLADAEKDEQPPVRISATSMPCRPLTGIDVRAGCGRPGAALLGDDHSCTRPRRAR
jgi:hypothetical protein